MALTVKNPYTLAFGKAPKQIISRNSSMNEIIDTFNDEDPSQQLYMITGVRGSGKTVYMTELSRKIKESGDWIVVELNPELDLLEGLAAKLSGETALAQMFRSAKINLSFFGFGVEIDGVAPIRDMETAIEKMLQTLKKNNKKVLVTIDEASNTNNMRVFASAFQIFIRNNLPIFLIMTGLYENIDLLQNEKTLTFLYRAPKIELKPLNIRTIAENYKDTFKIEENTALHMAKLTKGYSFAFQVLGYFTWNNKGDYKKALKDFRQYLDDYVYEKIWSGLSNGDKKMAYGIAKIKSGKISEIRELLGMETNEFNPYRKRLVKRGIVNGDERGYVSFTLPLFEDYVLDNYD